MANAPQIKKLIKKITQKFYIFFRHHHIIHNSSQDNYTCAKNFHTLKLFLFVFQYIAVTGGSARGPNSVQESHESIHRRSKIKSRISRFIFVVF